MEELRRQFDELRNFSELDPSKMEQWKAIGASVGRMDIVEEIKNAYKQSSIPLIDEIRQAAQAGQTDMLKRHFHKMKSGCGNVGFLRLQKMCEFSEEYLKQSPSQTPEKIQYICTYIDEEFQKSLHILETL